MVTWSAGLAACFVTNFAMMETPALLMIVLKGKMSAFPTQKGSKKIVMTQSNALLTFV